MRFKVEREPAEGETRIVKHFLFFPKCIGHECRWFEMARIRQRAHYYQGTSIIWWDNEQWEND